MAIPILINREDQKREFQVSTVFYFFGDEYATE
jgi:hypothetical protein